MKQHPGRVLSEGSSSRLLGSLGDVHAAGSEPLLRDCRDRDDSDGEQDDAGRLHDDADGGLLITAQESGRDDPSLPR